jgi:hypothetical protein
VVNAKGTREADRVYYQRLVGQAVKDVRMSLRVDGDRSLYQGEFSRLLAQLEGRERPVGRLQIGNIEKGKTPVSAATLIALADLVGQGVDEMLATATRHLVFEESEAITKLRQPKPSRIARLLEGLRKADAVDAP